MTPAGKVTVAMVFEKYNDSFNEKFQEACAAGFPVEFYCVIKSDIVRFKGHVMSCNHRGEKSVITSQGAFV